VKINTIKLHADGNITCNIHETEQGMKEERQDKGWAK
jgi:hypothetical protein